MSGRADGQADRLTRKRRRNRELFEQVSGKQGEACALCRSKGRREGKEGRREKKKGSSTGERERPRSSLSAAWAPVLTQAQESDGPTLQVFDGKP